MRLIENNNPNQVPHDVDDLIQLFNACFVNDNTQLVKGGNEPLYLPQDASCSYHRIIFRQDYFNSALHEVAHWTIAGAERRKKIDYGYWYCPDGRTASEQQLFEAVEAKPQAIEWIFSVAAGCQFYASIDNLTHQEDSTAFKEKIFQQALVYARNGLPQAAEQFRRVLANYYQTPCDINIDYFDVAVI